MTRTIISGRVLAKGLAAAALVLSSVPPGKAEERNRKPVKKIKRLLKQGTRKTSSRAKAVVKATATARAGPTRRSRRWS